MMSCVETSISVLNYKFDRGKRWLISHYSIIKHFTAANPQHIELKSVTRAGVQMLCSPKPQAAFDWRLGKYVTSNQGLVIAGSSAPKYAFSVWDVNTQKCIREFSVMQNPKIRLVQAPAITQLPSPDQGYSKE